jgi:hypothetical protein
MSPDDPDRPGRACPRPQRRRRRRRRDERASLGGAEMLGVLVAVGLGGMMLLIALWGAIDVRIAVHSAAREAARAAVEADDPAAARSAAAAAATATFAAHGTQATLTGIELTGALVRCGTVTVRIDARVSALRLPGGADLGSRTVWATHTEVVDPYRTSAMPEGDCDVP